MFSLLRIEIIYRPIFNILILFLALFVGNLGWAIVALTIIVRLLLYKTSAGGLAMQSQMGELQPRMQKIQTKYADDPKKMQEEMMKLMKAKGMGPLKGCLGMLLQLPIFLGLFRVIRDFANDKIPDLVYSFFYTFGQEYATLEAVSSQFLGIDLLTNENIILTALAGILIYLQTKLTMMAKPPSTPQVVNGQQMPDMTKMMGFMNVFLVFMMCSFVYTIEAGVGLYIVITTLFSLAQYSRQYRTLLTAKRQGLFAGKKGGKQKPEIIE